MQTIELIVHFRRDPQPTLQKVHAISGRAGEKKQINKGAAITYFGPVLEESELEVPEVQRYLLEVHEGIEMEEVASFIADRLGDRVERLTLRGREVVAETDALTEALEAAMGRIWADSDGRRWEVSLEMLGSTREPMEDYRASGAQLPHLAAQIVFRSDAEEYAEEYTGFVPVHELDDSDLRQWLSAARKRHEQLEKLDAGEEEENIERQRRKETEAIERQRKEEAERERKRVEAEEKAERKRLEAAEKEERIRVDEEEKRDRVRLEDEARRDAEANDRNDRPR